MADRKRETLAALYREDGRVSPWTGTAHAVLQAVNTYEHHVRPVRGCSRAERNMLRTVTGDFAAIDTTAWHILQQTLATA